MIHTKDPISAAIKILERGQRENSLSRMVQEVNEALALLRAHQSEQGWQSIETAKINDMVLLNIVANDGSWSELSIQPVSADYDGLHYHPTHWMPLPQPPKGSEE